MNAPHLPGRRSRRGGVAVGGLIIICLVTTAMLAPVLAPYGPLVQAGDPISPPGPRLVLGTNALGQDLLSQWLFGARTSLLVAFAVAGFSTAVSAVVGTAAALAPRGAGLLLGIIDLFLALPAVPIMVLLVAFLGPGLRSQIVVLVLVAWAAFARIVRAQVRITARKEYVEAERALGATVLRQLRLCIYPEIAPLLFTKFLLTVRWAILLEATLGLLGLADPTQVSWGAMLHQAFTYPLLFITDAWLWWAGPPALAIVITSLGLMAIGQDVDVWLNPHAGFR